MENPQISRATYLTPQEHISLGSTPDSVETVDYVTPEELETFYTPEGVTSKELTIEKAIEGRKALGYVGSATLASLLGFDKNAVLLIKLADLDETGKTRQDPTILGVLDDETQEMIDTSGRDLTEELYEKYRNSEIDLHLRLPKPGKERESGLLGPSESKG